MGVHILLNLLNELREMDKKARRVEHFISFSQRVH